MGAAIGDILPFAVGMAVFPLPIITVILLLFSPNARANGLGFVAGWTAGVAAATLTFALVADGAGADTDRSTHAFVSWTKLLLGVGLLFLAFRQWRRRSAPGRDPEMPGWMKRIDCFTPRKALGTGLLLSAGSPKNLILAAGAGGTVGEMGLATAEMAVVVLWFTAVASVTIAGPVLYYLWSRERAMELLEEIKLWLIQNSATVLTVMLLVLGAVLMGNGIRGLSGSA